MVTHYLDYRIEEERNIYYLKHDLIGNRITDQIVNQGSDRS